MYAYIRLENIQNMPFHTQQAYNCNEKYLNLKLMTTFKTDIKNHYDKFSE